MVPLVSRPGASAIRVAVPGVGVTQGMMLASVCSPGVMFVWRFQADEIEELLTRVDLGQRVRFAGRRRRRLLLFGRLLAGFRGDQIERRKRNVAARLHDVRRQVDRAQHALCHAAPDDRLLSRRRAKAEALGERRPRQASAGRNVADPVAARAGVRCRRNVGVAVFSAFWVNLVDPIRHQSSLVRSTPLLFSRVDEFLPERRHAACLLQLHPQALNGRGVRLLQRPIWRWRGRRRGRGEAGLPASPTPCSPEVRYASPSAPEF